MYHVELRQFPHKLNRFNLGEPELREAILGPWLRGEPFAAGERNWNPREATLTVLEGPQLAVPELSMGRGWRSAVRRGHDVTEQVLVLARTAAGAAAPSGTGPGQGRFAAPQAAAQHALAADLAALLGADAATLLGLWRVARERHPERTPSECLALAEQAARSLDGEPGEG